LIAASIFSGVIVQDACIVTSVQTTTLQNIVNNDTFSTLGA
jgi:hypothetical protein